MLFYGVLRAVSVSFGVFLQILIIFLQNSSVSNVLASLPPGAEDEIILIEHLPGRRIHLQDFFWTGPEDAPPWVDPNQGLTFYETRTVYHTVTTYTPGEEPEVPAFPRKPDSYDPDCINCIEPTPRLDDDEDRNIGVLIGDDPGPRYWLLTVLRAGESVPPKIELRLARLYRAAFSRQQQRHLGLLSTDPRSRRAAKDHGIPREKTTRPFDEGTPGDSATSKVELSPRNERRLSKFAMDKPMTLMEVSKFRKALFPISDTDDFENHRTSNSDEVQSNGTKTSGDEELSATRTEDATSHTKMLDFHEDNVNRSSQEYLRKVSLNVSSVVRDRNSSSTRTPTSGEQENESATVRLKLRSLDRTMNEIVQVRMQNMSVIEGGATRLIYSVHLGGKPVPAETAARDMALLSPQEVALELGAPVLIQSEPYLKETRPLALSRKRDAWLLIGAAGAGIILLALVFSGLFVAAKRKRAHSAVAAPSNRSILKREREYAPPTPPGVDNAAFSVSEMEVKTDGTSQRRSPGSLSREPDTVDTPDSLDDSIHEVLSDDDEEEPKRKPRGTSPWVSQDHPLQKLRGTTERSSQGRIIRTNAIDRPKTPDSLDEMDQMETLESIENGYARQEEATASPHSYLSMPSCKQFPSMRSVEPLSRVLEPVMVRHLDIDSPESARHVNGRRSEKIDETFLTRSASAMKDPGVIGPIVWNLRRQGLSTEGNVTSETDVEPGYMAPAGPVGRARRRLHELLEDSFSLFGSRDAKFRETQAIATRPSSATRPIDALAILSETRGKSAHVSPVAMSTTEMKSRPRTSLPRRGFEEDIAETGNNRIAQPRGAWGSRPLSAGPFHRPNPPEVDTRRILADTQLPPEDPAIPLISTIKKELDKFSPQ